MIKTIKQLEPYVLYYSLAFCKGCFHHELLDTFSLETNHNNESTGNIGVT